MIKTEVSFFLPCRKGSQRVKNKNTRSFSNSETSLIGLKLIELLKVKSVKNIFLSTDDKKAIEIAKNINDDRIIIDVRPSELCSSETLVEDLIMYVPSIIPTDHIFWVHATTPFVNFLVYEEALKAYFQGLNNGYDSLMSVTKYQSFLWDKEKNDVINFDRKKIGWPATQDLKPLYEINHAFYISNKNNYYQLKDRIGQNPFLFELDKIQSFDIDWEEDFIIAEALFKSKK